MTDQSQMNNAPKKTTQTAYYLTMQVAEAVLVLIGLAGMLSFIDFFLELARIRKEYIPMAPDIGLIFLIYGVLLIIERTGRPKGSIDARIWVASTKDVGTTFTIEFPTAPLKD